MIGKDVTCMRTNETKDDPEVLIAHLQAEIGKEVMTRTVMTNALTINPLNNLDFPGITRKGGRSGEDGKLKEIRAATSDMRAIGTGAGIETGTGTIEIGQGDATDSEDDVTQNCCLKRSTSNCELESSFPLISQYGLQCPHTSSLRCICQLKIQAKLLTKMRPYRA